MMLPAKKREDASRIVSPLLRNLSVLNYANGFTSWHYKPKSEETFAHILATGHFAEFGDLIAPGDKMIVSGDTFAMEGFMFGKGETLRFVLPHAGVAQQ